MTTIEPGVVERLQGLLEKATPLLNDCATGHENAAELAAQFQASTELIGGDASSHDQQRRHRLQNAETIRALVNALPSLLALLAQQQARIGEMEGALRRISMAAKTVTSSAMSAAWVAGKADEALATKEPT